MAILSENLRSLAIESSSSDLQSFWGKPEITCLEYNRMIREWPEKVFSCWSNGENLVRWISPRSSVDFRVGGVYVLSWGLHGEVAGEYIEIEPNKRLRFTWGDRVSFWTLVTVDFKAYGTKTYVRLLHQLFGGATKFEWNEGHMSEWIFFLDNLQSVIETGVDLRPKKAMENGWEWLLGSFVSPEPNPFDSDSKRRDTQR